ncbi:MAG: hypothetical protein KTR30_13610 [Saprospiraceae bacterium]|nr:hypothetical protein [Saprospiraceae bacterium]
MSTFKSTYHSKIYRDFKALDQRAYRDMVRFYEEREDDIKELDFQEFFELLFAYVDALFEIGSYRKHLLLVDYVIECSISNNIKYLEEKDVFHHLLFRKAASLYNTLSYHKADYILRELIRINPEQEDVSRFLKKCLRKMNPAIIRHSRAASILMFFVAAIIICVEVLFVRPFIAEWIPPVELSRNLIFGFGCFILLCGSLTHRWQIDREVNAFVKKTVEKKEATIPHLSNP